MKHKIILPILLISNIFLTSCGDFSNIKKNQLVVLNLDKNSTSTSDIVNWGKILTEEEAKLKALVFLEKYFNVKLYLTEVGSDVIFSSSSMVKRDLKLTNSNGYANMRLDYSTSVINNGLYQVSFFTRIEEKDTNPIYFSMSLDSKTGECIYFVNYVSMSVPSTNGNIDITEAKKIAKEFIIKNNIGNIKNAKFVNQNQILKGPIGYSLVFEDADAVDNKVMISIDGNTKKIYSFSVGVM